MERKKSFRILLLFTMLIVLFATLFMNNMKILTIVSLLQLVLSIYFCCKYLSFKFISSINIFLAFSYLFHASKYFIFKPEMEGKAPFALIYTASISEMNKALYFYILIQAFFMIGVAISKLVLKTPKSKVLSKLLATNSKKNYLFIGIVLILIGILPKVYIEISKLKVYLQGGYLATYEVSISGILSFVSRLFEFGMMMLLIYFRDNKKVALPILMLGILAELPAIFSGGRGIAIIILIVYALIFITKILKFDMKKIKWPYIIIALLIIHLTLSIINFIGDYRTTNIETSKLLSSFVPYLFKFSLFDIVVL